MGFTDDLGALGLALIQVAMYIDEGVKLKAKEKIKTWFSEEHNFSIIDAKIK